MANYSNKEEFLNAATHALGVLFGIAALSVMVTLSSVYGDAWSIVSCAIFGFSIVVMYLASSSYHIVQNPKVRPVLKKLDHIAIYYLIAGTYTPFILTNVRTPIGWTVFYLIWTLAIIGTILKLCMKPNGTKAWSILLYLAMGWLIILVSGHLFPHLTITSIVFLCIGGLFYTSGVFFYMQKSKNYTHAIWHVFVLLGTCMHFFAVLFSCIFVDA